SRSGVDLERHVGAAAGHELRGLADLPARRQVVPTAVHGDRGAVFHTVQHYPNRHPLSCAELRHDRLGNLDQEQRSRIRLCDRAERDRTHGRTGAGDFRESAANAGTGRVNPLRASAPTAVVSASGATAAWRRWLSRICPACASAERRCTSITTSPIAPYT